MKISLVNQAAWRQSSPYMVTLGLQIPPFWSDAAGDFFFNFPLFAQRLHILQGLINSLDFLTLVIGDKGSGKTTLLNRLIKSQQSNWSVCRIRCFASLDTNAILQRLANSFNIADFNTAHMMDQINRHLLSMRQQNILPLVVFDDCHELSPDVLYDILQVGTTGDNRENACLVFFSEPQINATLKALDHKLPKQAVLNKIYILPFNESQTEAYIAHRMKAAGLLGKLPMSNACISSIHERSGGLPEKINEEAHLLLLYNATRRYNPFIPVPERVRKEQQRLNDSPATEINTKDTDAGAYRPGWLLKQNPRQYTVQLTSARKPHNLEKIVKTHDLQQKATYFHTINKGKDWYTLVYGIYDTQDEADSVIQGLADELKKLAPWSRTVCSVHEAIKKGKRFIN